MVRRPRLGDPEQIRTELLALIETIGDSSSDRSLRHRVKHLVPASRLLRDMGASLVPRGHSSSARQRILYYLRTYPYKVISGDELHIVAGIQEWARRVRELRVEFGWPIVNGITASEMEQQGEFPFQTINVADVGPDDYILLGTEPDQEAARRWRMANRIRRRQTATKDKLLEFFRLNVGEQIGGEELRYVAGGATEWARRIRELRTEHGWPIVTRTNGRPELPIGVYVLEADRQSPEHDRRIPDAIRREILRRDQYRCRRCMWSQREWDRSDPRHLELHHIDPHAQGGSNHPDNLITFCTVCHDEAHRSESL